MKRISGFRIIAHFLAVLYGISVAIYCQSAKYTGMDWTNVALVSLFALLFVGSVGLANAQPWGRRWVVWGNFCLSFLLIFMYMQHQDPSYLNYIMVAIIVLLYINQPKISKLFTPPSSKKANNPKIKSWKSVLLIDDDEALIKTVRPILISAGYSVLSADTGEEGLLIAAKQKPDLIILDVILPGLKGRDVCKQLKENSKTKAIPVVFLTAKDSSDDIRAELEAGAEAHLTKPVNPKDLISCVEKFLS